MLPINIKHKTYLDKPPLPAVTSKPNKTNPEPDTTMTTKARTTTTIPATTEAFGIYSYKNCTLPIQAS
jgi:hypothetical protein